MQCVIAFFWRPPPLISGLRVWMTTPPALSEGLDPPLIFHNKVFLLVNFRDVANAFYLKIDESKLFYQNIVAQMLLWNR